MTCRAADRGRVRPSRQPVSSTPRFARTSCSSCIPPSRVLSLAIAVSDDGTRILGVALPPLSTWRIFLAELPRTLAIDVRPRSEENEVDPRGRGVVPVAILGGGTVDLTSLDPRSVLFGPAGASPIGRPGGQLRDVNGDEIDDLLFRFRARDTGVAAGDTIACVTGVLDSGGPFEGCDAIQTMRR